MPKGKHRNLRRLISYPSERLLHHFGIAEYTATRTFTTAFTGIILRSMSATGLQQKRTSKLIVSSMLKSVPALSAGSEWPRLPSSPLRMATVLTVIGLGRCVLLVCLRPCRQRRHKQPLSI
jgi:hypothetical protein